MQYVPEWSFGELLKVLVPELGAQGEDVVLSFLETDIVEDDELGGPISAERWRLKLPGSIQIPQLFFPRPFLRNSWLSMSRI